MSLFDTDHITALDRGGEEGERLRARLAHVPPEEVAVSVVSYEEQMRGWLAYIAQLRAVVERCAEKRGEQTVGTHTVTAERLHALAKLYEQGPVSDLMERTLDKLLRHEADACQTQLHQLQADLAEFEQKYQRSSTEFYQQFQAGQMGDAMDYVEWASLIQMTDNLTKRLRLLRGEASG